MLLSQKIQQIIERKFNNRKSFIFMVFREMSMRLFKINVGKQKRSSLINAKMFLELNKKYA